MKFSRRAFLAGVSILALSTRPAGAWIRGSYIARGWNTLPLGCGGLPTGINIANDGSMVCRTDVGNIYRWSGKTTDYANPSCRWVPLLTFAGLGASANITQSRGGWEHVLAPGNSNVHVAIFGDIAGDATKGWVYYGTWNGTKVAWNQSNLSFSNTTTDSNGNPGARYKNSYYKIAVDPVNENVAYCGMPINSGNSAGAYTTLNKAGGSTLATWASVKTSGSTPIPGVVGVTDTSGSGRGACCGLAFDPSQGTTTIGGQTVTKRIIIPIAGVGIYESLDGGDTFTEVAAAAIGSTNFWVTNGGFNSTGDYFCITVSATAGVFGIWRYSSGTWTKISVSPVWSTDGNYISSTQLIIKPSDPDYLSINGPNGVAYGFTTLNARAAIPTWTGSTGGARTIVNKAAPYDIGYINYIFGQNNPPGVPSAVFSLIVSCQVDPVTGIFFKTGNQSIYYAAASLGSTVGIGPPTYTSTGPNTFMQSIGRGMEVTVAQDVLCPPGGTYPVLACQDLGTPMRGTYTTYPNDMVIRYLEYTCENLEYAANDPSFIVARATGQSGAGGLEDVSSYSPNYGADGTWSQIAGTPTSLWQASITATISDGAGGAGRVLDVSACSGTIFPNGWITVNADGTGTFYGRVQPYGTNGTTGTGGVGTYYLDTTSTLLTPTALKSVIAIQGGQTVAVDKDHWVTVPSGLNVNPIPAYTTNATEAATWALCSGLPAINWTMRSWVFGQTVKPFSVGYGADLGKVWALGCVTSPAGVATLYRSDDSGANFHAIDSWSITTSISGGGGPINLSVPGFPGELWCTAVFTSGTAPLSALWHITNANTDTPTRAVVNLPADAPLIMSMSFGCPLSPGAYPPLYIIGRTAFSAPHYLYQGIWNGTSFTWARHGPTGTVQDLPDSCQIAGYQSVRGDWTTPGRVHLSSGQMGYAYYNP